MTDLPLSIDVAAFDAWRKNGTEFALLDVRDPWELEICSLPEALTIPLQELPRRWGELPADKPLVVVCHHGMRSLHAVHWLRQQGMDRALNLAGGIDAWARQIDPSMGVY
jgi:rhodanese-related sulfurtransferase